MTTCLKYKHERIICVFLKNRSNWDDATDKNYQQIYPSIIQYLPFEINLCFILNESCFFLFAHTELVISVHSKDFSDRVNSDNYFSVAVVKHQNRIVRKPFFFFQVLITINLMISRGQFIPLWHIFKQKVTEIFHPLKILEKRFWIPEVKCHWIAFGLFLLISNLIS